MEIDVINNGTVSATNPSTGATGIAAPASATEVGGVDGGGVLRALNVDTSGNLAALPLPAGAATAALQSAEATLVGPVTETAPATDTASSGLNGRLQRIAQRLTSLIALLPASLGQKAMAASLPVVVASDQSGIPVTGTFWQTTQPVSGTFWQATQPVSIATMPSTPVTGAFWQATQPVSIASMPSTPVTGTFWQATQPVSIASTVSVAEATPAAKTVFSAQITVGTTAVRATHAGAAPASTRVLLRVQAPDSNTGNIYIGPIGVTTATGMKIYPAAPMDFVLDAGDYYVISDAAAQTLQVLEQQ